MKGINKYLFLDVDGVLNSVSWYREEWLDSQTEPYVYAIVDDDRDMLSHQRKYFIKTNTVRMLDI